MDGDVCIQDTRSVADRRIHTQGRTTTCFKHRKNWRNCRITIFIVDELWFAVLKSEHCQNVWTISQAAMRRSLGINRSHSVSFRECLRLIFVCILPPKSCKTSEWDENDDSGPLCGGWHSKVGETRHSLVSTIPPFSGLTNILPLFWHEIQDKALEKRKIFDDVIQILTTFQIEWFFGWTGAQFPLKILTITSSQSSQTLRENQIRCITFPYRSRLTWFF